MNVQDFQNKLKEIQEIANKQEKKLAASDIRNVFAECELDKAQLMGVLKYLTGQGILIEGMETAGEEAKEAERKKIPLTPEEEAYYENYLKELPECREFDHDAAFQALAVRDIEAMRNLSSYYMKTAAELAVDMNIEELSLADLIQEANLCLVQALGSGGSGHKDESWLMEELRKGLTEVIEEQTQRKFEDDSLVARVEKLESAVRELSDDEDDAKNAFSIDELAIILDMNVEEIRDTLRLTGDDK